jgi:AcrR family transcriptional regulator
VNANSWFYNLPFKTVTSRISDLEWVRPVRQERSQRTLERLLDAAEIVIRDKGFADAAVVDIARRAGCSVGTFYRRFRDKQTLLHALDERFAEEFRATMEEAVAPERWRGAPIAEILAGYLEFSLEQGRARAALHRAALVMSVRDAAFAERQTRLAGDLHERLRDLLWARRGEIGHEEPAVAIEFALEQLRSMLLARLNMSPLDSSLLSVSDAEFVSEALTSVCAYLELPPLGDPEEETGDASPSRGAENVHRSPQE